MKHIETLKQALEALEWEEAFTAYPGRFLKNNITALRQAIAEAEEQAPWDAYDKAMAEQAHPIGWLYAEGLEALKMGKCWTAYGTKQDGDCSIPIYLNDAVAPKAEPRASESGAGFESLPASPNAEQAQPVAWVTEDGERSITHRQKQTSLRDGGACASTVAPFSVAAFSDLPPRKPEPLTDEQIDAAIKAWFETQIVHGRQPFAKRMRAAFAAAYGITKGNT
jgi:hypothetical protein